MLERLKDLSKEQERKGEKVDPVDLGSLLCDSFAHVSTSAVSSRQVSAREDTCKQSYCKDHFVILSGIVIGEEFKVLRYKTHETIFAYNYDGPYGTLG